MSETMGITLANGVIIDPVSRRPIGEISKEAKRLHREKVIAPPVEHSPVPFIGNASFRKRIVDLPAETKQLNPLLLIMGYFLLGLSDRDIAEVTGFTSEQVEGIRALDLFDEVRSTIVANLKLNTKEHIAAELENAGMTAAKTITSLMQSGDHKVRLGAAKDILDRVGFRPADVHEHNVRIEDDIRIRVIRDDIDPKHIDLPAMEITDE